MGKRRRLLYADACGLGRRGLRGDERRGGPALWERLGRGACAAGARSQRAADASRKCCWKAGRDGTSAPRMARMRRRARVRGVNVDRPKRSRMAITAWAASNCRGGMTYRRRAQRAQRARRAWPANAANAAIATCRRRRRNRTTSRGQAKHVRVRGATGGGTSAARAATSRGHRDFSARGRRAISKFDAATAAAIRPTFAGRRACRALSPSRAR